LNLDVWTDGTSRPKMISKRNKKKDGPSAIAMIVKEDDKTIYQDSAYAGIIDNNQAEYAAFISAVKYVLSLSATHVRFYTDSNLVEKQMNFKYLAHKDSIIPYYNEAKELLKKLSSWEVVWIPRAKNREADKMADDFIKQWNIENNK